MRRSTAIGATVIGIVAVGVIAYEVAVPRIGQAVLERNVAQFRASLGPGGSFTYGAAQTHPLRRAASFDDVAIHLTDGSEVRAKHLDIAPSGPHAIRSLDLSQVAIAHLPDAPGLTIHITDLQGSGLNDAVTPFALPAPGSPGAGVDPLGKLSPDMQAKLRTAAQTLQHVQADDLTVQGVVVDGTLPDGTALNATLGRLHIAGYGPGRSTDVEAQTFSLPDVTRTVPASGDAALTQSPKTSHVGLAFADFAFHKVRLADSLAFIAAGRGDGEAVLRQPSDGALDDLVATIRAEPSPPVQVRFGHVRVQETGQGPDSHEDATLDGLDFPAAKLAALLPDSFPDGRLHGHALMHVQADSRSGAFAVQPFEMDFDHVGKLRLAASGTIDIQAAATATQAPQVLSAITLASFSTGIADDGLRTGLLKRAGGATGAPPEMVAQLFAARAKAAVPPQFAADAPAIGDFVQQGGALLIDAKPAQPLKLRDFVQAMQTDPVGTAGQLGLTVRHAASLN